MNALVDIPGGSSSRKVASIPQVSANIVDGSSCPLPHYANDPKDILLVNSVDVSSSHLLDHVDDGSSIPQRDHIDFPVDTSNLLRLLRLNKILPNYILS